MAANNPRDDGTSVVKNPTFNTIGHPEITVTGIDNVVRRAKHVDDTRHNENEEPFRNDSRELRRCLKLYLFAAVKWKNGVLSFHAVYMFLFLLQITKVGLITGQIFQFGRDRANFSSIVNRGHLTLRHLLLKDWDASWETLPYPPAQGDFAVYTIDDLISGVDFSVSRFFNAEEEAIGYFVRQPEDDMTLRLIHFDFPGFQTSDLRGGLEIHDDTFPIRHGLHFNTSGDGLYSYSITEEFQHLNLSEPVKRLLSVTLDFTIHSVRVHATQESARCLKIKGLVTFEDIDNNGQVVVDLETLTTKISCSEMGLLVTDWDLASTSESTGIAVTVFCLFSLLTTLFTIAFALYACVKTKRFMRDHYRKFYKPFDKDEKDLPFGEYFRFVKLWDLVVIASDIFTLIGTIEIIFIIQTQQWVLETLDKHTVALGLGCVCAWVNLLRYFKFHNKFHLLFSTLYGAAGDVFAYMLCVAILFLGFWVCGFVVMGPYHIKFRTPERAMDTLFAIVNGDEIYATMALLEEDKIGGDWVFWFSRIYIWTYVAIFTIVIINLLVAIFMSSYEAIKTYYETEPDERDLSPVELALRRYMLVDHSEGGIRTSFINLLNQNSGARSSEETKLRTELSKIFRTDSNEGRNIVLMKPRTLKAFMEDKKEDACQCVCGGGRFKCLFPFPGFLRKCRNSQNQSV